jgi:SAM-dependent methyltransferase
MRDRKVKKHFCRWIEEALSSISNTIRHLPGGNSIMEWMDPLNISRRTLRDIIGRRAHLARGYLLDVGSGGQPYRELLKDVDRYFALDISPNRDVTVYGSAMALPFREGSFDTVLSNQVLEHVPEPYLLMKEAARVLKGGGILILTTPQTWGLHLEPEDYFRFTRYGLRYLAEKAGLDVIEIAPTCGIWATLSQRLSDTVIFQFARGYSRWKIRLLSLMMAPVSFLGYSLDRAFSRKGDTLDNILVARKLNNG